MWISTKMNTHPNKLINLKRYKFLKKIVNKYYLIHSFYKGL